MPFGVHALNVRVVVLPLCAIGRLLGAVGADNAAEDQPRAGADPGALLTADGSACCGTNDGADCGAANGRLLSALLGRTAACLFNGVLAADGVIHAEIIEAAATARQHHDRRAGGCADAAGECEAGEQVGGDFLFMSRSGQLIGEGGRESSRPGSQQPAGSRRWPADRNTSTGWR